MFRKIPVTARYGRAIRSTDAFVAEAILRVSSASQTVAPAIPAVSRFVQVCASMMLCERSGHASEVGSYLADCHGVGFHRNDRPRSLIEMNVAQAGEYLFENRLVRLFS